MQKYSLIINDCKNLVILLYCNLKHTYFRFLSIIICLCKHFDYFCRSIIQSENIIKKICVELFVYSI